MSLSHSHSQDIQHLQHNQQQHQVMVFLGGNNTGNNNTSITPAPSLALSHNLGLGLHGVNPHNNIQSSILVPYGWTRLVAEQGVVYISPSGASLCSLDQVREYLQAAGTCKCGLDCPLRPEYTFNFDPKVASKPCEMRPDLGKTCSFKRRTMAATTAGPGPPTLSEDLSSKDVSVGKKRKKKVGTFPGMSISQIMAQSHPSQQQSIEFQNGTKDRMLSAKQQTNMVQCSNQVKSPAMMMTRLNPCNESFPSDNLANQQQGIMMCQQIPNAMKFNQVDMNYRTNMTNHAVAINGNQMVNQQQNISNDIQHRFISNQVVFNGQQINNIVPVSYQNVVPNQFDIAQNNQTISLPNINQPVNNMIPSDDRYGKHMTPEVKMENDCKGKENIGEDSKNSISNESASMVQSSSSSLPSINIQQLTPEVIQQINQQQQIFIQQNQKQMEMAMRGLKNQMLSNNCQSNPSMNKTVDSNVPQQQNQMVIGTNSPLPQQQQQRVPPWQMNRLNKMQNQSNINQISVMNTPSSKNNIRQNNMQMNDSSQSNMLQLQLNSSGVVNEQNPNLQIIVGQNNNMPNIYTRVPPLHQPPSQNNWVEDTQKKKPKSGKSPKKSRNSNDRAINNNLNLNSSTDIKNISLDFRSNQIQNCNMTSGSTTPSFMDDPSGYLAQQTALLNNTISRQVGLNNVNYNNDNMKQYNNLKDMNNPMQKSFNIPNNSVDVKVEHMQKLDNNQFNCNLPSQSNIPDSSIGCDKMNPMLSIQGQCRGCVGEFNNMKQHDGVLCDLMQGEPDMRLNAQNMKNFILSMSRSQSSTPSPLQDESPVTSSTFMDSSNNRQNMCQELRGPIQGGLISTSNGSPVETFALPELSPTPSNSSRSTDTPLSKNSGSLHISSSCPFTAPSPSLSNQGSSRESINSNPTTPSPSHNSNQMYCSYNSPGPSQNSLQNQSVNMQLNEFANTFFSKNMFKDQNNIQNQQILNQNTILNSIEQNHDESPAAKRLAHNINGLPTFYVSNNYGSNQNLNNQQNMNILNNTVTTMASGQTLIRNTITSVLAGKAQTATTSINAPSLYPPVSNNQMNNSSMPNRNILSSVPDYPLHVAGSVTQNLIAKSPLEIVNNSNSQNNIPSGMQNSNFGPKSANLDSLPPGHILMPGNQIIIGAGNQNVLKNIPTANSTSTSNGSVNQTISNVGNVQQVLNQPTVLVNTLQNPFMLQSQMMTVDGQVVNQNLQVPQINLIPQNQLMDGSDQTKSMISKPEMLSPDSKKKAKKRKTPIQSMPSVLQIASQPTPGNVIVQSSSQQATPQQFSSQGFQMSPNGSLTTAPMLQALTIVPGKAGAPAHIVMNGQASANNFGSQQILTNSQGQHINLLQPVNLLNGTTGVVQNFPTFQQFIVPGLGGMVMADGTTLIQDGQGMPMQLQLQNVNGQNVLTPIQNQGIIAAGATSMVIRTQNPNNKIIQSQHSPGAQFLSPTGGQIVMGGSPFNGQLSPLVANVSPNQTVTFNTSPQQNRQNIPQDFIQCNQMGQTLMLPVSPTQIAVSSSSNHQNTTFVQQNTTIVQQQTTMVSNNQNSDQDMSNKGNNKNRNLNLVQLQNTGHIQSQQLAIQGSNDSNLKRITLQYPGVTQIKNDVPVQQLISNIHPNTLLNANQNLLQNQNMLNPNFRHSVSTQTLVNQQQGNKSPITYNQQVSGSSPPDTTTLSPLGPLEASMNSPSNSISGRSSNSSQANQVDTTTHSPEPNEQGSLAMVHCISSSEPDTSDLRESNGKNQFENLSDIQINSLLQQHVANGSNQHAFYSDSSSTMHFNNQTITVSSLNNQQNLTITPANYYQKIQGNQNKMNQNNTITLMPVNNTNVGMKKSMSGSMMIEMINNPNDNRHNFMNKNIDKHNMCNAGDMQKKCVNIDSINVMKRLAAVSTANEVTTATPENTVVEQSAKEFKEGDLVWGPAKGYPAWPGKLVSKNHSKGVEDGKVLVRWFGGDKYLTVVDPAKLQTLSEGLEAHHAARMKCRKSRKLNSQLEKAIQEAMAELDRTADNNNDTKLDINDNSSKSCSKNKHNLEEETEKTKSSKKSSRTKQNVRKIAPHPSSAEMTGRLRSSHR